MSKNAWFYNIPRNFFRPDSWAFSIYIGAGYLVAGILHYRIWIQSKQVENIFTKIELYELQPSPFIALILFCITSILVTIIYKLFFQKVKREGGNVELVFWGTIISLILSLFPWLYASSFVTTLFLFLFCIIAIVGNGLSKRLSVCIKSIQNPGSPDYWKMFVNAIKACAAIVAVLLGAIATTILLPWRDTVVEGAELGRYAYLCGYIIFGMVIFILMPLLVHSLDQAPTDDVDLSPPGPL